MTKLIKLDAINSTNSYLKEMVADTNVENFTVVVTEKQTQGRGQMQSKWVSEAGKNLTFSVFVTFDDLPVHRQKYLNFSVSLSVFETLKELKLPKLTIKWPNDILSDKYKICGILVENYLKGALITSSVIGIGLNVNQEIFPMEVGFATSVKNILKRELDLDYLLRSVVDNLKKNIRLLNEKQYSVLEMKYLNALYKKGVPSMFKTSQNILFMGKITGISHQGKLQIELDDGTIQEFGLKEVSFKF